MRLELMVGFVSTFYNRKNKKIVGFNKKENKNQTSYRSYVFTDWELPIFTEKFFKDIGVM